MSSRENLSFSIFDQKEGGDYFLSLLPTYATLFERTHRTIMDKSKYGWRVSASGKAQNAFFAGLDEQDIYVVKNFIEVHKKARILRLNPSIEPYFRNELDACFALDMNFDGDNRTEIGNFIYQIKYRNNHAFIDTLVSKMVVLLENIPRYGALQRCITYVPPEPGKEFHLPRKIAEELVVKLNDMFFLNPDPLVHCKLKCSKKTFKNLPLDEKIPAWDGLIENDMIEITGDIDGLSVILIDDLYQSGSTMWSIAKFLKKEGANMVVGIACEKTRGDRDNQ